MFTNENMKKDYAKYMFIIYNILLQNVLTNTTL